MVIYGSFYFRTVFVFSWLKQMWYCRFQLSPGRKLDCSEELHCLESLQRLVVWQYVIRCFRENQVCSIFHDGFISLTIYCNRDRVFLIGTNVILQISIFLGRKCSLFPGNRMTSRNCNIRRSCRNPSSQFWRNWGCTESHDGCTSIYICSKGTRVFW